jgi:hypothetical protein
MHARTRRIGLFLLIATAAAVLAHAQSAGRAGATACDTGLWQRVYHATRLEVIQPCVTVTGVIVDATATQSTHRLDGVRHEPDGDTHGWIRLDPAFQRLLDSGDRLHEGGNLVFEIICHYPVTKPDEAVQKCRGHVDRTPIPPVGTRVFITGSLVHDNQHGWNEIHPVSSMGPAR